MYGIYVFNVHNNNVKYNISRIKFDSISISATYHFSINDMVSIRFEIIHYGIENVCGCDTSCYCENIVFVRVS